MKILAKYLTADTQIHNGKCYFIGLIATAGKTAHAYNMESGGTAGDGNRVGWSVGRDTILPKPGVECSNGLYIANSDNACLVYYSLG